MHFVLKSLIGALVLITILKAGSSSTGQGGSACRRSISKERVSSSLMRFDANIDGVAIGLKRAFWRVFNIQYTHYNRQNINDESG